MDPEVLKMTGGVRSFKGFKSYRDWAFATKYQALGHDRGVVVVSADGLETLTSSKAQLTGLRIIQNGQSLYSLKKVTTQSLSSPKTKLTLSYITKIVPKKLTILTTVPSVPL
jgi:hypothetical protein